MFCCRIRVSSLFKVLVDRRNQARSLFLIASREEGVGSTLDETRILYIILLASDSDVHSAFIVPWWHCQEVVLSAFMSEAPYSGLMKLGSQTRDIG